MDLEEKGRGEAIELDATAEWWIEIRGSRYKLDDTATWIMDHGSCIESIAEGRCEVDAAVVWVESIA